MGFQRSRLAEEGRKQGRLNYVLVGSTREIPQHCSNAALFNTKAFQSRAGGRAALRRLVRPVEYTLSFRK
jgi:hypothetical protein